MAENSIYNVGRWETGTTYLKNNIAYDATTFPLGSSAVKSIKYYYSLRDSNQGNALPTTAPYNNEYWGGFSKVGDKSVPEFLWRPSYNKTVNHPNRRMNNQLLMTNPRIIERIPKPVRTTPSPIFL